MIPPVKLDHLFLASRVMTALYRIASTALLLTYLGDRVARSHRNRRVQRALDE